VATVADAYNQAGSDYATYADGDPTRLFDFEGLHAYADRQVWATLEAKLTDLRSTGATSISILDAGCGPGTWLRRLVKKAYALGFTKIVARGFDVARAQINVRGCWLEALPESLGYPDIRRCRSYAQVT
jgi:SAM-dependent methyltransferase